MIDKSNPDASAVPAGVSTSERDIEREEALELRALKGDIEAARELGRIEAPYDCTTNLDACPAAADAYETARATTRGASRVNGRRCRALVQSRTPFKGHGSIYGRRIGREGYGVFSYGEHWPLHVWDGSQWHHNAGRYSATTSKHYSQSHPLDDGGKLDCDAMRALVDRLDRAAERRKVQIQGYGYYGLDRRQANASSREGGK